jgi:hypothetical protein
MSTCPRTDDPAIEASKMRRGASNEMLRHSHHLPRCSPYHTPTDGIGDLTQFLAA